MPYRFPISLNVIPPLEYSSRIDATTMSVKIACPFLSPLAIFCGILFDQCLFPEGGFKTILPFLILSLALSRSVPKNRWSGRTQFGLSQRCSTHNWPGLVRVQMIHETR